jgi:hypothetical protein
MSKNYSEGAQAYRDIDPSGPMAHELPHLYLPLTGYDRRRVDGEFVDDDGTCCQFTAGRQRCQATNREHRAAFPALYRDEVS